ncbi:MAG: DUF4350 domain-containing protein [Gammaproteobacteria bacterium]|jgi:hypothetical protein
MRDSLITLAGALLSLFLLVSLMSQPPDQRQFSRPTTEDAGKHGLKAVHSWLVENKVNTYSLRKPYDRIDTENLPASGNLMIVSLPFIREALDSEWAALNTWIRRGNTVLVMAAMYHSPQWGEDNQWTTESGLIAAIEAMTAEQFTLQRDLRGNSETAFDLAALQESIQAFKPSTVPLYPAAEHTLFHQVNELESWHTPGLYQNTDKTGAMKSYWSIDSESSRLALRLLYADTPQQTAMWLLPVGEGWVYLSAFPDLVSNRVLKQQDNAHWFANLLRLTVVNNGHLIFDDYHFGLSDLYDPEAFFSDRRLHNSLLFIGAFWLLYALGRSPRLAPLKKRRRQHATTDFIEATAGFITRRVKPRALAKNLADRLLVEVSQRTRLKGEPLWRWLHDHPEISDADVRRLQRASGYRTGQTRLIQLTRSIDRIHKVLL